MQRRKLPTLKKRSKKRGLKTLGVANTQLPALKIDEKKSVQQLENPDVMYVYNLLGGTKSADLKMARRVIELKNTQLPYATTPELITHIWLTDNKYDFSFQAPAGGGRKRAGGSVIDFVVRVGRILAWRIQGIYWHSLSNIEQRDDAAKAMLVGQRTYGGQIQAVVDIWETQIYKNREQTFQMALAGVELGK